MPMQKRESFVPEERSETIVRVCDGKQTDEVRCRHKLGAVCGVCLTCGNYIKVEHLKYDNGLKRMMLKEEVLENG